MKAFSFKNIVIAVLVILPLAAVFTSCSRVKFNDGAIYSESFMWCDFNLFDDRWSLRAGVLSGGPINPPSSFGGQPFDPIPVPTRYLIRWFHFGEQRFFEASLEDASLPKKVREIVRRNRLWDHEKKSLIVCILDSHEVQLWLAAISRPGTSARRVHMELFATFQGYEVEGNPERFRDGTAELIEEGRIKPPPGWRQSPTGWSPPSVSQEEE